MGCGNSRLLAQDENIKAIRSRKLGCGQDTKEIGIQTSYTNLYDKLENEKPPTPKQVRTEGLSIHNIKPITNSANRRTTLRHDSSKVLKKKSSFFHQKDNDINRSNDDSDVFSFEKNGVSPLDKLDQQQANNRNSNNSQDFDSPFGQQRNIDSENKIDIQNLNSNNNSIQNSLGRDHINSPSLANQTANFFKNSGENDNFSSREYNHSSSPQIMSNNIIPEQPTMKHIIERQNNRTPTLSKPSSSINPTFSSNYILVEGTTEQHMNNLGHGIILTNSQYGKQLSEIDEEKEMGLLNNQIRRSNLKKSSIKVDNDSNYSLSEKNLNLNNAPSRGSANITTAEQTSPQNAQNISGIISNAILNYNNAHKEQIAQSLNNQQTKDSSPKNTLPNNQANINTNGSQKELGIGNSQIDNSKNINNGSIYNTNTNNNTEELNDDKGRQYQEINNQGGKRSGSFRIKKNPTQKSVSVHVSASEVTEKGISPRNGFMKKDRNNFAQFSRINNNNNNVIGNLNGMTHDFVITESKNNNFVKQQGSKEEQLQSQYSSCNTPQTKQGHINVFQSQKTNVNLIEFVKMQQQAQRETPNRSNSQNIYNHFKQIKQYQKVDSNGTLTLLNLQQEELANSQSIPLGLKQTRKVSRVNVKGNVNMTKFLSPKTNLIDLVQQIQFKHQRANSTSSQSLFQNQFQSQNHYDQNMEIDGLSPISSNVNPNFRGGYDYDVFDEEVAYQMENDKSHNNIASMTNFQNFNNSSSYEEQRGGTYSPISKEQSQTISVYPSVINGSEFCENSHLDLDNYEIEVQQDGYEGNYRGLNNLMLSQKNQQSQILNSQLLSQQNLYLPNSIVNSTSFPYNSKTVISNKQLPSQSAIINSQVIGSMNSFKINSPQLTAHAFPTAPSGQRKSSNITPTNLQLVQLESGVSNPQFKKVYSEFDSSPISQNSAAFKQYARKGSDQDSISPQTEAKGNKNYPSSTSVMSSYQQLLIQKSVNGRQMDSIITNQEENQNLNNLNLLQQQQQKIAHKNLSQKNEGSSSHSNNNFAIMQSPISKSLQQHPLKNYYMNDRVQIQSNQIQQVAAINGAPAPYKEQGSSTRRSNHSIHQNKQVQDNKNNGTDITNESKMSITQSGQAQSNNGSEKKSAPIRKQSDGRPESRQALSGSPSKNSSNHLSPTYITDKKIIRNSHRKTTIEIKENIRKLSDSSLSHQSNESILSNTDTNQIMQKTLPGVSIFQKGQMNSIDILNQQNGGQQFKDNNQQFLQEYKQVNGRQDSINSNISTPAIKNTNGSLGSASSTPNQFSISSNNNKNPLSNVNSNSNDNTSKSNSKYIINQDQITLISSNSNSISTPHYVPNRNVNLIELAKSNLALNLQREQIIAEQQQTIFNNKKISLIPIQNPNLLNSLYNISEEPNEQNTEIQSKTNFDLPSSSHGRSLIIDQFQTNSNFKPTQNLLLSNLSVQTQSENILTHKKSGEQYPLNSKSQLSQQQPSVSIVIDNQSKNNTNSQMTIPTTSIRVIQQNQQTVDSQPKQQKSQNLLDILSNNQSQLNNQQKTNTNQIQITSQSQPKVQITHQTSIPEPKKYIPDRIQVIADTPPIQSEQSIQSRPVSKENLDSQQIPDQNVLPSQENVKKNEEKIPVNPVNVKQEEIVTKGRVQELQRAKKRENSQKKIQQIAQPAQTKQKSMYSNTPLHLSQQVPNKSNNNNNLSVNSTILGTVTNSQPIHRGSSRREKFQKLSKANTANVSKTLSYSMLQEQHSVLETSKLDKSINADGQKQINQYIILKNLGQGAFGKVKQVFDTKTKKQYAVKVINRDKLKKKKLDKNKSAFSLIEKEIAICKKMAHPNIVKLYEYIDDQDEAKIYMIMDLLKKGSINSKSYWKIEKGKEEYKETEKYQIPETKLKKYFRDFLLGLDYLHTFAGVVHRDIKPDNLLIGDEDQLKIADFGVSQMFEGEKDEIFNDNGTKVYLAPEIFNSSEINGRPLDIWAAGVSFYEISSGERPFNGKKLEELKKSILETEPNYPSSMSPELQAMLKKCLTKDPKKRATVKELIDDIWVTDNGQNPLEFPKYEGDFHDIKDEEIKNAITKSFFNKRVNIQAKLKEKIIKTRHNIEKKKSFQIDEDTNNNTLNVNNL